MIYDFIARTIGKAIALVSPSHAVRYLAQHATLQRAYAAAKNTGPNQNWRPKSTSANAEIMPSWRKVTDRARALGRDNPYIVGAKQRYITNTVGEGMWPKCKVLGAGGKVNAVFARTVETAWEAWQEQACANGDQFVDVQRLVAGHLFEDGEILVRRVRKAPLQIEVLECDHLDIGKDTPDTGNGGRIVGGIEFGADGSRLAYWITPRHPGEQVSQSTRVPASEVLHIFDRRRASQARGISMFASVISELFDTCEYQDATMTLARVATAYGIFVESQNPEDFMPQNDGLGKAEDGETPLQYVNPGGIHYLRPGEKINTVKAEQPGAVYSEFVRSRLRAASAGSGMSYETFSNDYSQTNYSSARQALIQERALFRYFSGLIDRRLNVPIYRWWLDSQEVVRAVVMPGYDSDPRKFHAVKFSRPRQEWIDPAKEANAAEKRLSIGMETLTDLCEAEGRDVDEVFETRAAEVERMKALGIFQLDKPAQSEPEAEPAEENI